MKNKLHEQITEKSIFAYLGPLVWKGVGLQYSKINISLH
jgi:hypothetical protein